MKHKLTILLCVATSFMMQFVFTSCEEDEDEGSESCYSCYGFGGCIFCGTTGKCPICYGVNLDEDPCSYCRNTGKCPDCKGTGKCSVCGGDGLI
ncbi:hypothetical protein [Xylanibacter rodentium]|jgi:hypothetical protein|uniref:Uncharacterized protein n=1 Tax=Xylanibacter rodentium TaxID=2736289 RepID=A0ABX2AVZ4_9BACT|nr:hypothetical protein [Xylanibacter rodentium]NPE12202.1 hypothetical protein [Prevotella sp. PJ1A]NPE14490.1 hypothetical protein [Xylanibacter rodentium]NPE39666.1 hypothetical protein [Prevotella sp. PCJ2]